MPLVIMDFTILSVDGLGKLKTAVYLLLQHNKIDWQGSLKDTFQHYFSPSKLKPTSEVWENIASGKVNSLFQLNTPVGMDAVRKLKVTSIEEVGMVNSIMRLQPQSKNDRQPLDIFADNRNNIQLWYNELDRHGINEKEKEILEKHLLHLYGVADTQEAIMLISMDPSISNFTVSEANALRKAIARKNPAAQEEVRQLFYSKGEKNGARKQLLDYVWNVQVRYSLGYSFSTPHVAAYSYIALQEACIYTEYSELFWNTACLIDDAGAFAEEDFPDLIELGYIKASDKYHEIEDAEDLDDVEIESTAIDRDKIATSIAMFQKTANVVPPDINSSGFGFTLNEKNGTIQTGLKLVSSLGNRYIHEIIKNRPYHSFEEFLESTRIPRNRVVMLIKAGAFRDISEKPMLELLKDYVWQVTAPKKNLDGKNIQMLIRMELLPPELDLSQRTFNWWKYLTPFRKIRKGYIKLDEPALRFYSNNFDESKLEYFNDGTFVLESYVKSLVDKSNQPIKDFIKANKESLLEKVNNILFKEQWDKYGATTQSDAEMTALRMYTGEHPLSKYNLDYHKITDMVEDHFVGEFNIKGKKYPEYFIYRTVGTVIAKDKTKEMITLLTPEGAIKVKMWRDIFNLYDKKVSTVEDGVQKIAQGSFFEIGTHLLVFGKYQSEMLYPKVYKKTGVSDVIYRLNIEDGKIEIEPKNENTDT